MIPEDVLFRLPASAVEKLLLLDGLTADALDGSRAAQNRLNEIGRMARGGPVDDNPNVARLGAMVATMNDRHEALSGLCMAIIRWRRALPEPSWLRSLPRVFLRLSDQRACKEYAKQPRSALCL
jgi:hypothetical protein